MTKPGYFPILDCLRLIASLCVFVAHSIVVFKLPGLELSFCRLIVDAGYYGVVFFYTLSGFLITWLLLREKEETGTIAVRSFYIRRALRIWPMYYLIILLSFFVFPHFTHDFPAGGVRAWIGPFLLFLFFLPNIAVLRGFSLATCFHTYTIGYEEQFYLVWPLVIRRSGRWFGFVLAGAFFLLPLIEVLHRSIIVHGLPLPEQVVGWIRAVLTVIYYSNMPAFLAGGLAAFLYLRRSDKLVAVVSKRIWVYVLTAALLCLMTFIVPGGPGYVNLVSFLFAFLLLHLALWNRSVGRAGRWLAKGGKISYGIYMYHPAVLILVNFCMNRWHWGSPGRPWFTYIVFLMLSLIILLSVAALSYTYFEQYFLRKKQRFHPPSLPAAVQTGLP